MTGVLSEDAWLSKTTIASLVDIGFTLSPTPEPGAATLIGLGLTVLLFGRRRA